MNNNLGLHLSQDYLTLHTKMYSIIEPKPKLNSEIIVLNEELANELGINSTFLKSEKGIQFLSGTTNEFGPLFAQAYSGHQYGHYTTLGDGRALLLGEQNYEDRKVDLQLKGSGRTPYSRRGDGKATLYSMLREYLISEAMHGLKIPTTRSLAVIKTNENIRRQTIEPGGILCRVADSHLRVGTFEYANRTGGKELLQELADFAILRHYPDLVNKEDKYQLLLDKIVSNQASLIAKWQSVGFVHGVMNTDNMTISGETIDYGPCAFLDQFIPSISFSSIDTNGRYAYNQQPFIGSWNLARLAESMLILFSDNMDTAVDLANNVLGKYKRYYEKAYFEYMAHKIGIVHPIDEEKILINDLLALMEQSNADFTNTFRLLTLDKYEELPFYNTELWRKWFQKWTRQLGTRQMNIQDRIQLMEKSNPYIIPRNLLVEEALINAATKNDYSLYNELLEKLKSPYDYKGSHEEKFIEPSKSNENYVTFCGT